jgi:hypothetical protein
MDMWHASVIGEVFTGFWLGGPDGRDQWEDLDEGWRITLRWSLGRQGLWCELDSIGSGQGPVAGFCLHGNKTSGSMKKAGCCLTN